MSYRAAWLPRLLLLACPRAQADSLRIGVLGDHPDNALVVACAELGLMTQGGRPSPQDCAALLVCSASYPEPAALSEADAALVEQFLAAGGVVP